MKTPDKKPIMVGIGEALWDVLPEGKKLGGAPANFAFHVSQFGMPSCVVSAVGNDTLGHEITDIMDMRHIPAIIPTVPFPTGTVQVTLDHDGIPSYDIRTDVAWDHIPFTPELEALAAKTVAVCFGSLAQRSTESRNTIRRFIQAIPNHPNTLKIFDINLRQRFYSKEIIEESLRLANVLKINDEELEILQPMLDLDRDDFLNACHQLMERYSLRILILTCGVNGSYVLTADGIVSRRDTPVVEVADTVGAGDSFTAAFAAILLRTGNVALAHKAAVATSAHVVTQHGAMPLLPPYLTDF